MSNALGKEREEQMLFFRILLLIIAVVIYSKYSAKRNENGDFEYVKNKKRWFAIIPVVVFVLTFSLVVIPSNTVGVRWSAIGGTSEKTLDEGTAFVVPFVDKVYEIDTTVQERSIKGISVQTKDAQCVTMDVNVKYRVDKADAFKVYKNYRTIDNLNKNIIRNYSEEALLKIGTQYNVIDILGEKNNEFHDKVATLLKDRFSIEGVEFKSITYKDIDAGKEVEKAIANEAVAKKKVETAEQNRLKAEKDAETKLIKAKAEADANALLTENLTPEVLQKMFLEKWNGKLPTVTGEGNMIDISTLLK